MHDYIKLKYTKNVFNLATKKAKVEIVEISNTGDIGITRYEEGSKTISSIDRFKVNVNDYQRLCLELYNCIENADRIKQYLDDQSYELVVYRKYGRVDTIPGGYGNEKTTVRKIMAKYI